ncbi:MAG: hypothetical protein K2Y05_05970 [Hyphomicrobiaceae bacterium]|nr:hypothetical protein [Hyphomicrobiaceae bacterium]
MNHWSRIAVAVFAAVLMGVSLPARSGSAGAPAVEPIVLLDAAEGRVAAEGDRRIRGCGVRAVFERGPTVEIVNLRKGDATELVLTVSGVSMREGGLKGVALATSGEDTATLLSVSTLRLNPAAADPMAAATLEARGPVDPDAGARLFQQLIVGGGTATINRSAGPQTFAIPGPLPHAVRTAFLNCSGDLFPRTR